jgi:uncharacterized membrane protein
MMENWLERSARSAVIAGAGVLLVVVCWRIFASGFTAGAFTWALFCTAPLWIPLRWLLQRNRTSYAIFTLCVVPYLVAGLTEAVANPPRRAWAGLVLVLSFLLFVALIIYLRVTRPVASAASH